MDTQVTGTAVSTSTVSRRSMLARSAAMPAAIWAAAASASTQAGEPKEPFRYCLNTGSISGYKLPLGEEVRVAAAAGYQGIEPWIRTIEAYTAGGGSLAAMRRQIADAGLVVESAIGFARWAVDDNQERRAALEQLRREMDMVAGLGGKRIAAPPAGINKTPGMDLAKIAQRYRDVLELGRQAGVVPQLEIWGSALTLGTAAQAAQVACGADHPDACLLLDAYHLYKGGSGFECLRLLNGAAMHVFHINDYPAQPPRETIADADRVYPGDGVCPLDLALGHLYGSGFRGALSLEIFNREYWATLDPLTLARRGLEKSRAAVAKGMSGMPRNLPGGTPRTK